MASTPGAFAFTRSRRQQNQTGQVAIRGVSNERRPGPRLGASRSTTEFDGEAVLRGSRIGGSESATASLLPYLWHQLVDDLADRVELQIWVHCVEYL